MFARIGRLAGVLGVAVLSMGMISFGGCGMLLPGDLLTRRPEPKEMSVPEIARRLKVGDDIDVISRDGRRYRFHIVEISKRGFIGTQTGETRFPVALDSLKSIRVERNGNVYEARVARP